MSIVLIGFAIIYSSTTNAFAEESTITANSEQPLEEAVTLVELEKLEAYPDAYQAMSPEARIDWLNSQVEQTHDAVELYRFRRSLAFEYFSHFQSAEADKYCQSNAPLSFDLVYRYLCAMAADESYETTIDTYLKLYEDATEVGDEVIIAQVLMTLGWEQSGNGDIKQAFESYNEALSLGEHLDFYALNDAMANLASLYVIHGDEHYVNKGIELHKKTIKRLQQKIQDEPGEATYLKSSLVVARFNTGVAYALHLRDYEEALKWFKLVNSSDISLPNVKLSSLLFSSMSAAYLDEIVEAEQYLAESYKQPEVDSTEFYYLYCYRELVRHKIGKDANMNACLPLHDNTPLEVKIDVYKRISELDDESLRSQGQEHFYQLFIDKLEKRLKQSSSPVASTSELYRKQQEDRLKNELLEKEVALKTAQQKQIEGQYRLVVAMSFILILLMLLIYIRFSQKRRLARQYKELSIIDTLTGLKNRRFLEQNIERELGYIKRTQGTKDSNELGIFLIDIDHFKEVNDTYGHAAGDKVLIEFARRINSAIRDVDLFVRWGGEEFILVARLEHGQESMVTLANRLSEAVKQAPYQVDENIEIDITCTIGAVLYPCGANTLKDMTWNKLVKLSDMALYYGKYKQRDCWVCIESVIEPESWDSLFAQDFEYLIEKNQVSISSSIELPNQ
ncbi:hypothetical protein GCM10009123_19930 [Kangiella japonica]|uniref:diguanylate cyclase n=2 Tax=Kangiella japonica TaxID=647384 RepID=A0ABN0T4V5_9GAMM